MSVLMSFRMSLRPNLISVLSVYFRVSPPVCAHVRSYVHPSVGFMSVILSVLMFVLLSVLMSILMPVPPLDSRC